MPRYIFVEEKEFSDNLQSIFFDCFNIVIKDHFPKGLEIPQPEPDRYITKKEAAKLWGRSVSTIDNFRRAGILKRYRIGSAVRFKRSELLAAMEEMNKKGGKL